jgi:hypothetical protein
VHEYHEYLLTRQKHPFQGLWFCIPYASPVPCRHNVASRHMLVTSPSTQDDACNRSICMAVPLKGCGRIHRHRFVRVIRTSLPLKGNLQLPTREGSTTTPKANKRHVPRTPFTLNSASVEFLPEPSCDGTALEHCDGMSGPRGAGNEEALTRRQKPARHSCVKAGHPFDIISRGRHIEQPV